MLSKLTSIRLYIGLTKSSARSDVKVEEIKLSEFDISNFFVEKSHKKFLNCFCVADYFAFAKMFTIYFSS